MKITEQLSPYMRRAVKRLPFARFFMMSKQPAFDLVSTSDLTSFDRQEIATTVQTGVALSDGQSFLYYARAFDAFNLRHKSQSQPLFWVRLCTVIITCVSHWKNEMDAPDVRRIGM